MSNAEKCKERVFPSGMAFPRAHQCTRAASKDGYCKTHHPDAVAARKAKSEERWNKQAELSPWRIIERQKEEIERLKSRITELSKESK